MSYQICSLGGTTYPYNPVSNKNPKNRTVAEIQTLKGRVLTDWGSDPSRQDILQQWPVMDKTFFGVLQTKALAGGTMAYIDDDGTHYTVIPNPPTFDGRTAGGDAYLNVQFKLQVVSSP